MQSCVIVLLKLLLATVTGPGAIQATVANAAMPPGVASPANEYPRELPAASKINERS